MTPHIRGRDVQKGGELMRSLAWVPALLWTKQSAGAFVGQPRSTVLPTASLRTTMAASSAPPSRVQEDKQGRASLGVPILEREDESELGRSNLLKRLEEMEGIWYSDDFYGRHGREWVEVRATLVGAGSSALVAVKVAGDANVPSGCKTWRTRGLPSLGATVPAEVQVRMDVDDPNGFYWLPASLTLESKCRIALSVAHSAVFTHTGTFHKHQVSEGE